MENKGHSEYFERLVKAYGYEQALRIWQRRHNKNLNFKEMGDKLSIYLNENDGR